SGSGKSTILKMVYRSYLPGSGRILYDSALLGFVDLCALTDREVIGLRDREIGYVSQFLGAAPRSTSRGMVERAMLNAGFGPGEARAQTEDMLSYFEISPTLWDGYVGTLSGGEKLRLNLARAMAKKPRLLLLDEPTASLDPHAKARVRDLLMKLKAEGATMLGIFHDIAFMDGLCDRVYPMELGRFREPGDAR
ncbi:MAG: ATP-binding cassette domain-containing protein, partial [Treponema sp.]|nr:ATP-binding cassette domain-containing protein [Treponema sp.]